MPLAKKNSFRYVAFLRGINVGGHAVVSMAVLRDAFRRLGLEDVRTVLASGNVVFTAGADEGKVLAAQIAEVLRPVFKRDVGVIVRTLDHIEGLHAAAPFGGIAVTPAIRFYVSFLPHNAAKSLLSFPYAASRGGFRILKATAGEVFSVLDLAKGTGTPEAMAIIEKEFGRDITTRNWNTVLKILAGS